MKPTPIKGKGQTQRLICPANSKLGETKKHYDGDTHFCYNMTILIGCSAQVTTRTGQKFEGIFVAYSAAQEVMLEAAHLITQGDEETVISTHYDVLIIPTDKVLAVLFENVDLSYPTREFQTDFGITSSHIRNFTGGDKELTPWDGADGEGDDSDLDCSITENGWEPQEMFRKNEEKYGVVSSYNQDLAGYTTQLDKTDAETFRKHEEQAALVALEIEKNTFSTERSRLENGDDEEEAFSAVVRPRNNINLANNNNAAGTTGNDKYIVPSRRPHTVASTVHVPPIAQNPPSNNNGSLQINSNNTNTRKPVHLQNSRNNFGPVPPANMYHQNQDRRMFDSRRSPHLNQYGMSNSNADVRRVEDPNRPPRPLNKSIGERKGREEIGKTGKELMDFHSTFNLQSEGSQGRRTSSNSSKPALNAATPLSTGSTNMPRGGNGRNMSTGSGPQASGRLKKEDTQLLPPLIQSPVLTATTKENSITTDSTATAANTTTSASESAGISPNVSGQSEANAGATTLGNDPKQVAEADSRTKESDTASKKFTFNPNAKEFNPTAKTFPSRSPGTPPRAPSTPSSTPHVPPGHSYVPIQMPQTLVFAPQYAQTALTPSSNSMSPVVASTPRHPNQRKAMLGGSQRSDISPSLQISNASSPLLAPSTIQSTGQHTQYFSLPAAYSQVRIHPQNMVSLYSSDGSVGTQMHLPMHYIPHNGSAAPNALVNQHNSTPPSNPTGTLSTGQTSGHGYGSGGVGHGASHHVGYPIVGLPVVGVSYQHSPYMNMNMISHVPHVSHQGSGNILPHSQ